MRSWSAEVLSDCAAAATGVMDSQELLIAPDGVIFL